MSPDYEKLATFASPEMVRAVRDYLEHGQRPECFLYGFLCNDLREAMNNADDKNRANIIKWLAWFYFEAPSRSHGCGQDVEHWIREHKIQPPRDRPLRPYIDVR